MFRIGLAAWRRFPSHPQSASEAQNSWYLIARHLPETNVARFCWSFCCWQPLGHAACRLVARRMKDR